MSKKKDLVVVLCAGTVVGVIATGAFLATYHHVIKKEDSGYGAVNAMHTKSEATLRQDILSGLRVVMKDANGFREAYNKAIEDQNSTTLDILMTKCKYLENSVEEYIEIYVTDDIPRDITDLIQLYNQMSNAAKKAVRAARLGSDSLFSQYSAKVDGYNLLASDIEYIILSKEIREIWKD